ncbi:MAG: ABC transporter ATP-binding protein [Rhodospirillales bacterium]|nr:ABC transporter ATP-binding protein [Rhodospirillales bacterium]
MTDLLIVRDLKVDFHTQAGVVNAVNGISFRVPEGGTVALVGESGSGKSVTAQAIMGILPRTAEITGGEILFHDPKRTRVVVPPERRRAFTDLANLPPNTREFRSIRGNSISIIFQEPMTSLSPLHTIGDQIREALLLHREISASEARDMTIEMLGMVGFPNPQRAFDAYTFELSGGLRQRAMIAMALVCRPSLLIADEPSTALDVTIQAQILKLIKDLQAELNMAVLIITHDLGVVANIAEEVVVAYNGSVVESGTLDDIFSRASHPYLKALLRAVPHFNMKDGERLVPIREIEHQAGHLLSAKEPWPETDMQPPLLEVRGVTKTFRMRRETGILKVGKSTSIKAVDDVSLKVRRGKCLGLVGESGCGKTTLSKIILSAMTPDAGEVLFDDRGDVVDLTRLDAAAMVPLRRKIQYVFQDPFGSLNPRMTVFEILSEPLVIHNIGDDAYRREMVTELMRLVGLDPRFLNRYPHSFSGGQRQRIGIARALALKPDLLICDEPVSALDVSVQAQILNLLKDLQSELGLTYLFISHNLAVVDYVADDIAVMCGGRIVEVAPREVLFAEPVHPYTKALLSAVPYPDPDRCLDFTALMEGRASDPDAWPHPFDVTAAGAPSLLDFGQGHMVRTHATPQLVENQ